ncbi:2TM domain-containing protein [Hymenobacter sp. CRA2]|uniref:2TM domain-containing protein n=1 Tax=Hymenobacter sp. CRA2 TaxID=1955620 RepID=UPI0009902B69|nr:2TM domain-containing protein [Hymenobacter sp. CRA2]OON67461.1 hypothetical protein B0919_18550 [Hymenobacter sp. CRA2]
MNTTDRDPQLWSQAQARGKFKSQLLTFVLVSALLWTIWFLTQRPGHHDGFPWPIWATVFWGIHLATRGFNCYGLGDGQSWTEREYQHLLRQRQAGRR